VARMSTIKKNKKNIEKTSVKYIALPASLPSGLKTRFNYKLQSTHGLLLKRHCQK